MNVKQTRFSPASISFRGFTLIELLVVVGIISILATIAIPNFLEANIRSKVSRMKSDMRTIAIAVETYRIDNNHCPLRRNMLAMAAAITPPGPNGQVDGGIKSFEGDAYYLLDGLEIPELKTATNPFAQVEQLSHLTTPIAYLPSLLPDMFQNRNLAPNNLLDYWDPVQTMWFINHADRLAYTEGGVEGPDIINDRIHRPGDAGYLIVCVGPDGFLGHRNCGDPNNPNAALYGWPATPRKDWYKCMYRPYDPSNGTQSIGNIYLNPQWGGLDGVPSVLTRKRPFLDD